MDALSMADWVMLSLCAGVVGYIGAAFYFYKKVYTAPPLKSTK